jgi:hypothetical protein
MLQCLDESEEVIRFLQALYNLEGWEIAGVVYTVPPDGLVKSPTEATDLVECWGSFGYIKTSLLKEPIRIMYSNTLHCTIALTDTGGENLYAIFTALAIGEKTRFALRVKVLRD